MNRECSTCLDCDRLSYSAGSPGYSEYTPGWDADLSCGAGHWVHDAYNDGITDLRAKFYASRSCKDFVEEA